MTTRRYGITLLETLVVIGIIGILLAVLLPAVQHVRETARRTTCQNNVRQTVLATLEYESAHASLPHLYNGTFLKQPRYAEDEFHYHSWRTALLPLLEQNNLHQRIDFSAAATDAANQANLNTTIAIFLCPSTPSFSALVPEILEFDIALPPAHSIIGTAARSDYEAIGGVAFKPYGTRDLQNVNFGVWGEPRAYPSSFPEMGITYRKARLRDISDGLSNTVLIGERAGRPDLHQRGKPVVPYPDPQGMDPTKRPGG